MDNIKPAQLVKDLVQMGAAKANLPLKDLLIRGFLSGAFLGYATVLAFTTTVQTGLGVAGALLFPVGFSMIVLLGLELVTGNFATVPMAVMSKEATGRGLGYNWFWVFTANLAGSVFFGSLFFLYITKVGHTYDVDVIQRVIAVAEDKTLVYKEQGALGMIVVFVKAFLCNWMVTLGVVLGMASTSSLGKIVGLWLPIFSFFALGLEHSVVNMFVIPTAMMLKAPISAGDWWFWNQIPVTIGNIAGGFILTGYLLHKTYYKKG